MIYVESFLNKLTADHYLAKLTSEVPWIRRDLAPRMEAFYSTLGKPYTYGSNGFSRSYNPEPIMYNSVQEINNILDFDYNTNFKSCFLNRYLNQTDHLGWHADDSPEIDVTRPIAIVSLGVEREIWFCEKLWYPARPHMQEKILLKHGSLLLMPAGFQQTHYHRIPKSDRICGERISLTYRGSANV